MSLIKGKQLADATVTADKSSSAGALSTINAGDASVDGVAGGLANKAHQHGVSTGVPVDVSAANAEGVSSGLARSDHAHAHGDHAGGTLHADATVVASGFLSATDKLKLDALVDPNVLSPKDAVRILATANVVLSGSQVIDGVATAVGNRVAALSQTATADDGIYVVAAGAWARADDFGAGTSQSGAVFAVEEGTSNGDTFWQITNDDGSDVVGTNDISVLQIGAGTPRSAGDGLVLTANTLDVVANADGSIVANAGDVQVGILANDAQHGSRGGGTQHAAVIAGGAAGFITGADKTKLDGITAGAVPNKTERQESLAAQAVAGSDVALGATLSFVPSPVESLSLYLNGVFQKQGPGSDYTIAGSTITWLASTGTAVDMDATDEIDVTYRS